MRLVFTMTTWANAKFIILDQDPFTRGAGLTVTCSPYVGHLVVMGVRKESLSRIVSLDLCMVAWINQERTAPTLTSSIVRREGVRTRH